MGAVYQAKDLKRQTICAVKEMSLSMVPAEERLQAIQNFKVEAKILWGLNHPNLPAFTGFFTEGQRYFMVMEYVDGSTLEDLLERNGGPFSERRVLGWARQLCDVLEYLHSQNPPIIFRDMKPGNIMFMRNGRIKLIDFGIARFFRPTSSQDTQLLGTPGFAPPEQYGKTQTDERSDIYSLAITLFQLLTNTLSETGFGLKDVRAINPQISPVVAKTLERAASLQPENRYDSVATFRRALLGVGTFVFDNGDHATTAGELADLCARYPEEASDYLAAGEIELWLSEINEADLARAARQIRTTISDPYESTEQLLQVIMGSKARIRSIPRSQIAQGSRSGTMTPPAQPVSPQNNGRSWLIRKPASPLQVTPRTIDFGQVYPGISAPLTITITGDQGQLVSGTIHTSEPWILIDLTQFDGMSTRVNVRINNSGLRGSTPYTGTVVISPDGEELQQDIVVTVKVEILGNQIVSNWQQRRGKTVGADLDDDEDEDVALTMGSMTAVQQIPNTMLPNTKSGTTGNNIGLLSMEKDRDSEYKKKYGQPGTSDTTSSSWDPLQVTARQRLWIQRGQTFAAAFMVASLFYTLLSALPPSIHVSPLPPSPWFILVLAGMVPAATLGALLVNWNRSSPLKDTINYACTGMGSSLVVLALVKTFWQLVMHQQQPALQLFVMLLVTSVMATVGTNSTISEYILYGISWALAHARMLVLVTTMALGGLLGFSLTADFAVSCFTPFGVLLGIVIAFTVVLRVDHLMRQNHP